MNHSISKALEQQLQYMQDVGKITAERAIQVLCTAREKHIREVNTVLKERDIAFQELDKAYQEQDIAFQELDQERKLEWEKKKQEWEKMKQEAEQQKQEWEIEKQKIKKEWQQLEQLLYENKSQNMERQAADVINVITGSKLKYPEGKGDVNMCLAIQQMREESELVGQIKGAVLMCKDLGVSLADTIKRIAETFHLSEDKSSEVVKQYW